MIPRLPPPPSVDELILGFDRALRTLFVRPHAERPYPGEAQPETDLSEAERAHAAGLMRVNHAGEVCAQALYQGQSLTARDGRVRGKLEAAAREEEEHLAWTQQRLEELGGGTSLLNPLWYAGSLAIGAFSGLLGDRWSLGFLKETERQVEAHLSGHLDRLPDSDARSRAVVDQMKADEIRHAEMAEREGAADLPAPVKDLMRLAARFMTTTAYRV